MGSASRAELFRLLGDEDRLRLLALCCEDELSVGELASLLHESQPQVTKKTQPLREAGLLVARKDGTRTLLKSHLESDPVIAAAVEAGRALCAKDGSLARIAGIISQREELSRRYFDEATPVDDPATTDRLGAAAVLAWLPVLRPLLPGRALAVDLGTGEGTLLPLLSPLFDRVVAVDRSPARLARCGVRIAAWSLPNVRLCEGDVDDAALAEDIAGRGGADLVVMARVLHHAARPQDAIAAATRLVRPGGHLLLVDYLPHDDESMREQGDVWLGFEPAKLKSWLDATDLEPVTVDRLDRLVQPHTLPLQLAIGKKPARAFA